MTYRRQILSLLSLIPSLRFSAQISKDAVISTSPSHNSPGDIPRRGSRQGRDATAHPIKKAWTSRRRRNRRRLQTLRGRTVTRQGGSGIVSSSVRSEGG